MKSYNLQSPVTYQGAKHRIASKIIDIINPMEASRFFDICCGSGAISMELVSRGFPPSEIYMIDAGPWGLFWESIGSGTFSLYKMKHYCSLIPEKDYIKEFMEELSKQDVNEDAVYIFLLLQASSFGGKAIWIKDNRWQNCTFRSYWKPTATSSRRSPVNPMMPMADTILKRLEIIMDKMQGVHGLCYNIVYKTDLLHTLDTHFNVNDVVYIDPNYADTTGYGFTLDANTFAVQLPCKAYVSEGKPMEFANDYTLITGGSEKGGISGNRSTNHKEYLSRYKNGI